MLRHVCLPPEYRQWVDLLDGRRALIRPISYADKKELLAHFNRLSEDTRFFRFHYAKETITEEELDYYCTVDYDNTFALVAEMPRNGRNEIVGVGRYTRLPGRSDAEVAFVVEDKEQRNGICTNLLRELAKMAKERGVTTFVAEIVSYNKIMLNIFRRYAPLLKQVSDGNSSRITFSI